MTNEKLLLDIGEKFLFYPLCGNWIEQTSRKIEHEKTKLVSIITSDKNRDGTDHWKRHEIIKKYGDKLKSGNYRLVGISDTGRGNGEKSIDRIFDPYFSTKKSVTQKGRGLVLTIANRVIINHTGLIKVFSTPGKGSTMAILLSSEPDEG